MRIPFHLNVCVNNVFSCTSLRSDAECSHPHNILLLGCELLEDPSCAAASNYPETKGPLSSLAVRPGVFLQTTNRYLDSEPSIRTVPVSNSTVVTSNTKIVSIVTTNHLKTGGKWNQTPETSFISNIPQTKSSVNTVFLVMLMVQSRMGSVMEVMF